jgi:nucleotide-binding universal stress UspA family protein
MKKFLIPTDFSLAAENAAHYALALAKKLKADIIVCNAFKVPSAAPTASQVAWPLMDYTALKQEVTNDLDSLVKLLSDSNSSVDDDEYCPKLAYESNVGDVCDVVASHVEKEKAELVIMGMAGAGGLTQFILGSNSKEMIEKATVPVLLVPFEAGFNKIRKIAFATDLNTEDIVPLQYIVNMALPLNAEITIVHITNKEVHPQSELQRKIDVFLNKIRSDISLSGLKYQYVWNIEIDEGLSWITEHEDLDLMAITHHHHSLLARILKGSHTQKLSRHIKIPLLVFPPKYISSL